MKTKSFLIILSTLAILSGMNLLAQISVSNQLEYSNWEQYNRNVLENWTDISYQKDQYTFGFRYEINQPPDRSIFKFDTLLRQEELTYRYAEIYNNNFTITIGNYYALFGRGLILRTYEDRNLRVDNNIDGVKANYYTDLFEITALGGRARDKYNRRKDRLYGFDGDINLTEDFKIGGSFLRNQFSDKVFTDIRAIRGHFIYSDFDFYTEFSNKSGNKEISAYGSLSYSGDWLTLLAEYKDYNQLTFASSFETEYNAPPSLTREHTYTMLNRHPHQLDSNNEVGYQFELTTDIIDNFEILLNSSQTYQIVGDKFTDRFFTFLGVKKTYNRLITFEEYYGQISFEPNDNWHFETALGWNADHSTNTENITPIAMGEYNWDGINELHLEIQHQHVKIINDKSEYDDEIVVFEYTRSPFLNLIFVGEYSNKHELVSIIEDKSFWLYGQISLSFLENQQISLLYGSRQAGFVCVGGVCRFEPEFEGFEIKLISRF